MQSSPVSDALRSAPLLAGIGRAERNRLVEIATLGQFDAGETILREGGPTLALGIVHSGRVALRLHVPGRGPFTVLTVEPGDIVGWSAVVPPYRATSTAVAVAPTRALILEAEALRQMLEAEDELAAALYPAILRSVSRRLEMTRLQLLDLFGTPGDQPW